MKNRQHARDWKGKPSLTSLMQSYAKAAVNVARQEYKISLTYTEGSLVNVEKILARVYQELPRTKNGRLTKRATLDTNLDQICKAFGAYIGEVMRRKWSGRWRVNVKGGNAEVYLQVRGTSIYPISKVYKRLTNGEEDNIHYCYLFFRELLSGKISADQLIGPESK